VDARARALFPLAVALTLAGLAILALRRAEARRGREADARERSLRQARDQQTATAEILRVIAGSPTDARPVFDAIVARAVGLCDARIGSLYRVDDGTIDVMATAHPDAEARQTHDASYPRPLADLEPPMQRLVSDAALLHLVDVETHPGLSDAFRARARTLGYRTAALVALVREGRVIGLISVARAGPDRAPRPFSDREIGLLQVFADQAVIAIENARLFQELQARNHELTEALERETATRAILQVMSGSPTDIQPVLDAVAESATRLCDARDVSIALVDGDVLRIVASHGHLARWWPDEGVPINRGSVTGRAVVDRQTVHVHDLASEPEAEFPQGKVYQRLGGHRTNLAVPLLREGVAIGVIAVRRAEVRPFTDRQIRLLETFADQAVIAIENVRLFQELQARNHELTEALGQQTATAEILRVISSSLTDLRPVFGTIVRNATRICEGSFGAVYQYDGERIHFVAHENFTGRGLELLERGFPVAPSRDSMIGRAILDASMIHVPDLEAGEYLPAWSREVGQALNYRSLLVVPMLREGRPIGAIAVSRGQSPFSERQINVVQTFADQAVIAIENVRLFRELEARNRELTESLEQQTATSEILGVISRSPTNLQPVLEAVARSASRLCGAANVSLYRVEGSLMRKVAEQGPPLTTLAIGETRPVTRTTVSGRAIVDRTTIHLPDYQSADMAREYPDVRRDTGIRTTIGIPLLREGAAIGAFTAYRTESRPFSDREIALLQTFADQAVIAIENVRLFRELETRNRELTESLEQQTATSEILRAISASPTDTQPVFETIAQRAVRVCDARDCLVFRFDGRLIHIAAHHNLSPESVQAYHRGYPVPVEADTVSARTIRERAVIHIADLLNDQTASPFVREMARMGGYRSGVSVPMLRSGSPIGAIGVTRVGDDGEPRPFSNKEIALLQTFADQAVIAVENVRLFRELETKTRELSRSVQELTALAEVSRAVTATLDVETVLQTVVSRASQLAAADGGSIFEYDEKSREFQLRATHAYAPELAAVLQAMPPRMGEGVIGAAAARQEPMQVADIVREDAYQSRFRDVLLRTGYRALLAVPLVREGHVIGALSVNRKIPGEFPPEVIELLRTFATQSALAIQNARLFREIETKGRELEVASRHKSQFLANMSHELRTPLNAILGYTELLVDGIYGELAPKVGDVMARIDRSGKHLLGLINDVLDLSKIEAGQLELALADYSLREVVHAVVTQVEALAAEKGLALRVTVPPDLPAGRGDERRLAQVLLNLVGNAIKFTEAGDVRITAQAEGDAFVVSVADTGPGIAEADQRRIFEEFQQADSSSTRKKGGTGLGLSIARRIVELHGGRLWVDSALGRGSTFSFRVPVRVERQVART
jgi:GAF domain-containing protein